MKPLKVLQTLHYSLQNYSSVMPEMIKYLQISFLCRQMHHYFSRRSLVGHLPAQIFKKIMQDEYVEKLIYGWKS